MESGELKREWTCEYCHESVVDVAVVPDQSSLLDALANIGLFPEAPEEEIKKPPQFKIPPGVINPGESWTCTCQLAISADNLKSELSVKVYLDYEKYLAKLGMEFSDMEFDGSENTEATPETSFMEIEDISFPSEKNVDADLADTDGEQSRVEIEEPNYKPEEDSYGEFYGRPNSMPAPSSETSSIGSCVSQMANLHGYIDEYDENELSIEIDDYEATDDDLSTGYDADLEKIVKDAGITINDKEDNSELCPEMKAEIYILLSEVDAPSQPSASSRGRKRAAADYRVVERVVNNFLEQPAQRFEVAMARPVRLEDEPVDVVTLSDDTDVEEGDGKPVRKRKRLDRQKDVSIIDLVAIGLGAERDNYIRFGRIERRGSMFGLPPAQDEENRPFYELRQFRQQYRADLMERAQECEAEPFAPLLEEMYKMEEDLNNHKIYKELVLESCLPACPTNPVESALFNYAHPIKVNGMKMHLNRAFISNHKLAVRNDEIHCPSEFSDNFPSSKYFVVQKPSKTNHTLQFLKKISQPLHTPPKFCASETIHMMNRQIAETRHGFDAISKEGLESTLFQNPIPAALNNDKNPWDNQHTECSRMREARVPRSLTLQTDHRSISQVCKPVEGRASDSDGSMEVKDEERQAIESSTQEMSQDVDMISHAEAMTAAADLFDDV